MYRCTQHTLQALLALGCLWWLWTLFAFRLSPPVFCPLWRRKSKHKSLGLKTAAVQMWRANVPLMSIRAQLKLSERTLRHILAHAKSNPHESVKSRKEDAGRSMITSRSWWRAFPNKAEVIERGCVCSKY